MLPAPHGEDTILLYYSPRAKHELRQNSCVTKPYLTARGDEEKKSIGFIGIDAVLIYKDVYKTYCLGDIWVDQVKLQGLDQFSQVFNSCS